MTGIASKVFRIEMAIAVVAATAAIAFALWRASVISSARAFTTTLVAVAVVVAAAEASRFLSRRAAARAVRPVQPGRART